MEYFKRYELTQDGFQNQYQGNDYWIEQEFIKELEALHPDMEPGTLQASVLQNDDNVYIYEITIGLIPR